MKPYYNASGWNSRGATGDAPYCPDPCLLSSSLKDSETSTKENSKADHNSDSSYYLLLHPQPDIHHKKAKLETDLIHGEGSLFPLAQHETDKSCDPNQTFPYSINTSGTTCTSLGLNLSTASDLNDLNSDLKHTTKSIQNHDLCLATETANMCDPRLQDYLLAKSDILSGVPHEQIDDTLQYVAPAENAKAQCHSFSCLPQWIDNEKNKDLHVNIDCSLSRSLDACGKPVATLPGEGSRVAFEIQNNDTELCSPASSSAQRDNDLSGIDCLIGGDAPDDDGNSSHNTNDDSKPKQNTGCFNLKNNHDCTDQVHYDCAHDSHIEAGQKTDEEMEVDLCTILNRHNNMASSEQKTNPGKMERQLDVKSQTLCNGDRKSNIATSVISVNSSSPSLVNKKSNANTYICRPHLQQKCDICTTGDCSQKDDLQDITDSVSVGSFHNKTEQDFNNQSCELSKNQKTDGNCDGELVHAFDTKTALSPDKDNKMIKASDSASFLSCSPTPAKPGSDDPQIDSPTDNSADSNTADHLDKFDSLWTNHSCTDERSENSNCTQQSCDSFEGKSEFNKEGTIDDSRAVEDQLKDQPPVGMQSAICNYHKNTDSHSQNLAATKNTGCSVCFQNQIICSSSADVSFTCTSPKHQVKSFNNEARQYSHSQSEVTVSQLMSEIPSTMSTSTGTESDIRVKSSEHSSSTANSNNEEPPEQTIKQANWGAGSETCDRSDTAESAFDFNPKINSNIDGRYNPHSNTNTAFRYCPTLNSSMNYRNFFSPLFEDKLHLETTKTETSRINTGSFNHNNKTMNDVNNDIQLSEKSTWVQTDSGNDGHEASLTEREKTSDSNRKRDCEKEIQQGNVTEVENERMPGVRVGSVEARGGNSRPLALSFMSLLPHQSVHIRSNNSTKNLKCPWCNWHYKYKETLDAHVREKHEGCTYDPSKDRDSQGPQSDCRYCMSGNDHPLLGQGEVHVCGFKPYHCAACDYSTNSKGNLIIHTQSDKHLVRMQDLQLQQGGLDSKEGLLSQSEGRLGISRRVGKMGHIKGVLNFRSNFPQNLPFQMMGSKNLSRVFLNLGYPRGLVGQLTVPPQLNYKYYSLNLLKTQDKDSQQKLSNESENPVHYKQEKGNKLDEQMEERRHGEEHEKTEEEVQENKEEHVVEQNHKQEDNTNKLASSKEEYKVASPPAAIFQCLVCLSFTTNQLPLLLHHSLPSQHSSDSDTWWRDFSPESSSHLCLLCQYSTPLSANFGLHIKTGRHCSRLAVAQHLRKHGIDFEGRLGLPGPPPPLVHLSCRACQYQSQSFAAMKQHAKTTAHEQAVLKYQHTFSISLQGQLSDHHIRQPEIITAPNGVKSPKPGIDNNGEEHVTDGDSVTN